MNKDSIKDLGFKKVDIKTMDNDFTVMLNKYKNQKPSKKYIESIEKSPYFQLKCPKCKWNNRKWLDAGKNPYFTPIKQVEKDIRFKTKKGTLYLQYVCRNCRLLFP